MSPTPSNPPPDPPEPPPSRDRTRLVETIFLSALEKPCDERGAFVAGMCAGDTTLRADVEELLAAEAAQPAFLRGAADDSFTAEKAGERIGRYKLLQEIGEGGFGTVWMAEQMEPVTRRVALKIIKLGMDTREVIARFEAERQALAMMDHPNIARVLDAGATDKGRPFFVMELVKGVPITRYCDEAGLGTRERLALFGDVCSAINHAHQKGIIHRDIKPSNVMVTMHGDKPVVKVIDFGIAKATQGKLTDKTLFTRFEQFIGTPVYMSPEQAATSGLDIDTRSDIYGLGILLYELLTGKPPFDAKTLASAGYEEMRRIIREVEPPKPSSRLSTVAGEERLTLAKARHVAPENLRRLVEPDLDWIVMKAIEKDRTRRYETANGLALDIQRFLADEPVSASPPGALYKFRKFARRNKTALRVTAGIAALLVAATAVSTWQAVRATDAEKKTAAERDAKDFARQDAEAISKFLTEVFQSPDPEIDGYKITVAKALNKAVEKLEADRDIPPARRAILQATLGSTCHALGLYREAIPLREKVRDYFLATSGLEHPNTLGIMHDLASSYSFAGRLDEAIKLHEEVLTLRRKVLGPEHPDTINAMNNIALTWFDAGRRTEALRLQEEVMPLNRKVFGQDHPDTLAAMNNLALSCAAAGRGDEALKLREEVLTLVRKLSGPKHPHTLMAMNNLALSFADAGRRDEALKMREEVLTLRREVSGPEHPHTLLAMHNLALSCFDAGRRDESRKLHEEVLTLRRKVQGPEHPHTLSAMHHMASHHAAAGRADEALKLREEVLALRRKVLGLEHADTLKSMESLAESYASAGRWDETLKLREEFLPLFRKVLGPEHSDTIRMMQFVARHYAGAGRRDEALKLHEEALPLFRKVFGPKHPDTVLEMDYLADSYMSLRNYSQAEPLFSELLNHARDSAGTDPSGLESRLHDMAEVCYRQQRYADAEALYRERMESRLRRPGGETSDMVLGTRASLGRLFSDWAWAERATAHMAAHQRAIEGEKFLREVIAVREADSKYSSWRKADLMSRLGGALIAVAFTDPGLTAATREPKLVEAESALQRGQAGMEQDKKAESKYQRDGIERLIRLYEAWGKPDKLTEWKQKLAAFDEAEEKKNAPGQR